VSCVEGVHVCGFNYPQNPSVQVHANRTASVTEKSRFGCDCVMQDLVNLKSVHSALHDLEAQLSFMAREITKASGKNTEVEEILRGALGRCR